MTLATLLAYGFDQSKHVPFTRSFKVGCSQCEALTINGTPTHETGCIHAMHECNGCNNIIPRNQRYCEDCI